MLDRLGGWRHGVSAANGLPAPLSLRILFPHFPPGCGGICWPLVSKNAGMTFLHGSADCHLVLAAAELGAAELARNSR